MRGGEIVCVALCVCVCVLKRVRDREKEMQRESYVMLIRLCCFTNLGLC